MKPISFLGYLHLTKMAKPVCDREVYQLIRKHKFRSFVEIGLGAGSRCEKMIQVAQTFGPSKNVRYTGIDFFDSREEGVKLPLIEMHRRLKGIENAKTQLVPGPMLPAVSRIANSHVRTDLIVISHQAEQDALEGVWFYFPRMLHAGSIVLLQSEVNGSFRALNRHQIEKRVKQESPGTAKAA